MKRMINTYRKFNTIEKLLPVVVAITVTLINLTLKAIGL